MERSSNDNKTTASSDRPKARSKMRTVFNLRLLVETLIVAAVIGPGIYLWYYFQVKRSADAMLDRAEKLIADKDDAGAAQLYFQYLKLKPGDADVQVRLAETFDRAAKNAGEKPQAVEYYYQALGVAPADKLRGLRLRLAELLIELRRFASAEEEAREILARDPKDVPGNRLLALALFGQSRGGSLGGGKDPSDVGKAVEKAWKMNPADVELALVLADIYRNRPELAGREQQKLSDAERAKLADDVMDKMVAADPKDAKALLARHRYLSRYRSGEEKKDLAEAIEENPDDLAVVLQAAAEALYRAESLRREGGSAKEIEALREKAKKHFEHAIELSPSKELPYLGLADLYVGMGKLDLAAETLRRGLDKAEKNAVNVALISRLANVLMSQDRLDEAGKTIADLERLADQIAPTQPQPVRLALKRTIDALRGKWLAAEGRYTEAATVLRRVTAGPQTAAPEIVQSWLWLGRSYAMLGRHDQAASAFEQAAALDPKAVSPHLEAAAAWSAADRPDAAEQHYLQALELQPSADIRLALAAARLQKTLRSPAAERNWEPFLQTLAEVKKSHKEKPLDAGAGRLKLLEVDYLLARGEVPAERERSVREALALCGEVEREDPDSAGLLPLLAAAYERLDRPAEADRVLKRLEEVKGQEANACLLKAKLLAARKQFDRARTALTAGLKTLPEEMRPALRSLLVQVALREGRPDQAREQLLELHREQPANIHWLIQLAELSFESGKPSEVEQWEKALRKLEGDDGVLWRYFRVRRLLTEAAGPDDAKLAEASKLQAVVQSQRPAWPQAHLLNGLLSEARGKFDQAADAYREAIRLGERQPLAFQRLISLLLQTNQAGEADRYLALMHDQAASTETFSSLESVVAARRGQIDRALESALRGAEQRPKDPLAQLWLGQVYLSAEKIAEAETALKKAVELAPDDPRALGGLFGFYVRAKRPDDARSVLEKLAENKKLEPAQRASFLAQGYESLGDREQAAANYREAARLDAGNPAAQVRLAGFLLRTGPADDRAEPEKLLREALRKSPDFGPARRMLAQLLVERGGERAWREARGLVEEAGREGPAPDVDRRLQALLLARRAGKQNLDQARRILEELTADPKKAADADRRLLARLYEACGDVDAARRQYQALISRENSLPADTASYLDLLIRYELFDEADGLLKKLEAGRPDDLGTAALRARWLRGKGQTDKIEPLIEPLADKIVKGLAKNSTEEANFILSAGNLYSALEQHKAAERWYRRLVALRPNLYPPLAGALARQERMKEALELCVEAAKSDSSALPATAAGTALLAGKPTAGDFALAEPLLSKALSEHKDDARLLSTLASVRVVEQRLDEAVELFRQAQKLNPDDAANLNNLATLLSERPEDRKEALNCIDRAIEIAGPQPGLLDTKGMILVLDNKPADAVPLLEQAAASPLSDPRYHFHLAAAYDRTGQSEKARAAFLTARKNHLTRQILTPTDRSMLEELTKKFD